ncbi:MAG: epoxyqueuosine reductase [Bacteroidales bacterium]|nr:epoxyqueuosine reductase [Bacteroidales bacterium]
MAVLKETDPSASEMIRSIVEKYLIPPEQFLYGFADLNRVLNPQFGDFRFGISIGQQLDYRIVNSIKSGPTPAYYDHYKTTNEELSLLSQNIAQELNRNGIETLCIEPTISTDKLDSDYYLTLRSKLSHKMVATRAGLGWIGKTALFISKEFGPRLRLVTILTNTPLLISSIPVNKSRCGKCVICVEACPAKTASGQLWDTTLDRDQFFDAQKCRAMCKEFGERILGPDARICGICVSVCPIENNNRN